MTVEREDPGAIAVAHRAEVTELAGKDDLPSSTPTAHDLQIQQVLGRFAISRPLAVVVAGHAFCSGRQS